MEGYEGEHGGFELQIPSSDINDISLRFLGNRLYTRTSLSRMAIFRGFHPGQRGIRNSGYRELQQKIQRVLLKEITFIPIS